MIQSIFPILYFTFVPNVLFCFVQKRAKGSQEWKKKTKKLIAYS